MERRLATILAADVVGFSRMVEADEEGTLIRLAALRKEVLEPSIAAHSGKIFKHMGDGLLVEFASVVDATRAALAIQREMEKRQRDQPAESRVDYRIGLNLGDIVADAGDFFGDGVNIAARLEALADPGGILISGTVFDHLKGKLDAEFQPVGLRQLKNISQPVRVYRADLGTTPSRRPVSGNRADRWTTARAGFLIAAAFALASSFTLYWWRPWQRSESHPPSAQAERITIAVMPFVNVSQNPAEEYFAEGMTEDLITDLAKFPEFQVTARTSTTAYKGKAADIREISRELAVNYILEGSVDKNQETIRVTAQLVDGANGSHLWAERYDRPLSDLFVVRDEIRVAIIGAITSYTGPLLETEMRRAERRPENAVRARDLYYQAFAEFSKFNAEANAHARALLKRSISLDPNDASVFALLAWTYFRDDWLGWSKDWDTSARLALEAAKKAVALEPSNYKAHWSLASAYRLTEDQVAVEQSFKQAFTLNPNDPDLLADWGEVLRDSGHLEEAIAQLEWAMQLNPRYPAWYAGVLSTTYFMLERYEESLRVEAKILEPSTFHRLQVAAANGYLGNTKGAKNAFDAIFAAQPDLTLSAALDKVYWDEKLREQILNGLRKAGLTE